MKRVKVISTQTTVPVEIQSNATTFGELKRELSGNASFSRVDWSSTAAFQRDSQGRRSLALDDERISSEESFTLFISPSKHKGGMYSEAVLRKLRTDLLVVFAELLGEDGTSSPTEEVKYSIKKISRMDYDQLVEVIDSEDLDIDASGYDEDSSSDMKDLRDDVCKKLGLSGSTTTYSKPVAKPAITAQEQRDLDELLGNR